MGKNTEKAELLSEELYRELKRGYWNPPTVPVPEDVVCGNCADAECAFMVHDIPDAPACAFWTNVEPNYSFKTPSYQKLLELLLAEHEARLAAIGAIDAR
jgi:hypothetical protein